MEGVPIRAARRGDMPSLLLLWGALMKENERADPRLALHARAREHMANQLARFISEPQHHVVVAEEGGRLLVAFGTARVEPGNGWQVPRRLGRIVDCYVVPPRRRKGIARRMVGRMVDLLYEDGAESARLAVATQNEGARAFWDSIGFTDLEAVLERPQDAAPASTQDATPAPAQEPSA